jgi:hypothetical protein
MNGDVTFGELAIGDTFEWRDTAAIQHGPNGPEPMTKTTATRYAWSRGYGSAKPHYPVRKIRRRQQQGAGADV